MIKVAVGDENASQPTKTDTRPQDLTLGSLPTINQESVIPKTDNLGRQSPVDGGG
jgi:hypothetical protein